MIPLRQKNTKRIKRHLINELADIKIQNKTRFDEKLLILIAVFYLHTRELRCDDCMRRAIKLMSGYII